MTRFSPHSFFPDPMDQPETYTYLLRLRRTGPNGTWRIRLEVVGVNEHHAFATLEDLHQFLQARMAGNEESSSGVSETR